MHQARFGEKLLVFVKKCLDFVFPIANKDGMC